jgi:uncharacterized membrane protein (UPF0127 family)
MKVFAATLLAILLILSPLGCSPKSESNLPVTSMQIGPQNFNLEIATSYHDQEVGLMHRDHLDPDHGMIFPMPKEEVQTFWNHDVHFPLDLIFLDNGGTIVSFKHLDPFSEQPVPSDAPAKYVIELIGGTLDHLNLKIGDHLTIPKAALAPAS